MLKAKEDFKYVDTLIKKGDEVKPDMFEAEELNVLLSHGMVVDTEVKKVEPAPKTGKEKSK